MNGFSFTLVKKTEEAFRKFQEAVGRFTAEKIECRLVAEKLSEEELFAVKWIYANSPLSDALNFDVSLFCAAARHGIFLRGTPYASALPEEIFLCYVLHPRVNDEELCDCRKFFYETIKDRVLGKPLVEAALEINYFNAEQVVYRSTDGRTRSALSVFSSGFGRCGEESVFAVNVFRALGIAARQVYAPRWSHCDDNHAWVEIFDGKAWRFLGACEPEETLDQGWFNAAAGRAMLIRALTFCDPPEGEFIGRMGAARSVNVLKTYAKTKLLCILVQNEQGEPEPHARVEFGILNYAQICPVASAETDENGCVRLTCGEGSLFVRASKGELSARALVDTRKTARQVLSLQKETFREGAENFVFYAPEGTRKDPPPLSDEQRAAGEEKKRRAAEAYRRKMSAQRKPGEAEKIAAGRIRKEETLAALERSAANFSALSAFLSDSRFPENEKEGLLLSLSDKDLTDVDPEILFESLRFSRLYRSEVWDEEFFNAYLACPRIEEEPLSLWRAQIFEFFSEEQKRAFRQDPRKIAEDLAARLSPLGEFGYGALTVCPSAALLSGRADPRSKKILFVAICRTLGIPARLDPVTKEEQFFENGKFVSPAPEKEGTLVLEREQGGGLRPGDFSLTRICPDGEIAFDLTGLAFEEDRMTVRLPCGNYRLLTVNRLPNGNLFARETDLSLQAGETRKILLQKYEADLSEMLFEIALKDLLPKEFSEKAPKQVLFCLETGREPTEHLLNEILARREEYEKIKDRLLFVLPGPEALEDPRFSAFFKVFPGADVAFWAPKLLDKLARRVFLEPGKLPLSLVQKPDGTAVYACAGYNVGSGDLILKIIDFLNQK